MLNVILLPFSPELLIYLTQGREDNHCWRWKGWRKDEEGYARNNWEQRSEQLPEYP